MTRDHPTVRGPIRDPAKLRVTDILAESDEGIVARLRRKGLDPDQNAQELSELFETVLGTGSGHQTDATHGEGDKHCPAQVVELSSARSRRPHTAANKFTDKSMDMVGVGAQLRPLSVRR